LTSEFINSSNLNRKYVSGSYPKSKLLSRQYFREDLETISSSIEQHWNQLLQDTELRFPLLYRPLVELMFSLPPNEWYEPSLDRKVMRRALKNSVPQKILNRKDKKGPDESFFSGFQKNTKIQNLLLQNCELASRGYIDFNKWCDTLKGVKYGIVPRFSTFFTTVGLELWLQQEKWSGFNSNSVEKIKLNRYEF